MGHWCWMCGRVRPNEKFSGKGHRNHLCKDCSRLPKEEQSRVSHLRELEGYFSQSHISRKNCTRLSALSRSSDPTVARMARVLGEVARVAPCRRRRFRVLKGAAPAILAELIDLGLMISGEVVDECETQPEVPDDWTPLDGCPEEWF